MQSRIEGVVNEFASLIIGLGLLFLASWDYFKLIHASYLVIILVGLAIVLATALFAQYKRALKGSLLYQKQFLGGKASHSERSLLGILQRDLRFRSVSMKIFVLRLMEYIDPVGLRKVLVSQLGEGHKRLRVYAYQRLVYLGCAEYLDEIKKVASQESDDEVRNVSIEAIRHLQSFSKVLQGEDIHKMLRSTSSSKRRLLAQMLVQDSGSKYKTMLLELIKDPNVSVRQAALCSAGVLRSPDYFTPLCDHLPLPAYGNTAVSALSFAQGRSEQTVNMLFYRTNQELVTMFRVVQILSRIRTASTFERIWKKIDYPQKYITDMCIRSLSYKSYRVSGVRQARLRLQLEKLIGNMIWNIQVRTQITGEHPVDKLLDVALVEENKQNNEDLFVVMSLIYDSQSVQLVRDNIEFDTPESVAYAIELMSIFVDDALKRKILPLFDDLTPQERVRQLSPYYAPERYRDYADALVQLIHRDYNSLNRWTKALALYRLSFMEDAPITRALIANIYNPDMLLLQTTAYVILQKDRQEYRRQTQRLPRRLAKQLDMALLPPADSSSASWVRPLLWVERCVELRKVRWFRGVPYFILSRLVDVAHEGIMDSGRVLLPRDTHYYSSYLYVLLEGKVSYGEGVEYGAYDVVGMSGIEGEDKSRYDYVSASNIRFLRIEMYDFFDILSQHSVFLEALLAQKRQSLERMSRPARETEAQGQVLAA